MIQSIALQTYFFVSKVVHQINLNYTIAVGGPIFGTVTLVLLRKKRVSNHLSAAVITLDGSICKVIITIMITVLVRENNLFSINYICIFQAYHY